MKTVIRTIKVIPEACSGCRLCELTCSFAWVRYFNLTLSRIIIDETDDINNPFAISFTEECNDCGLCVKNCFYGALELIEERT